MTSNKLNTAWLLVVAELVVIVFAGYRYYVTDSLLAKTESKLASTTSLLSLRTSELASTTADRDQFFNELTAEQKQTVALEKKIQRANSKVSQLRKIVETDPELLVKYSKVFFLNENYIPTSLIDVPVEYLYDQKKPQQIHEQVWPYLERMIKSAEEDGVVLNIVSGYRSFTKQVSLKTSYSVIYGSGANAFSADQGYSEHQLGTTVDFNTPGSIALSIGFANSKAYQWLLANAYRYGFVLSYPKGNAYYIYEPWHWRFVGEDLANDLHDDGKNFYDLDQRDIDGYLGKIFD